MAFELTVGALCAAGGRERIAAHEDPYASPAFRAGLLYSALFYVPAAVVFVRVWSDWSSHYLFDAAAHPAGAAAFAYADASLLFVSYVVGFALAARRIRAGRLGALLRQLAAGWIGLLLVLFVALAERSLVVTTTSELHRPERPAAVPPWGDPRALLGGPLMYALLASSAWNGAPLAILYRSLRRRARTRAERGAPPTAGS